MNDPAARPALSLTDVSKAFGKIQAVSHVSLDFFPGEFCVILGPSGCGKTTLLNVIAGLVAPDSGQVAFGGETINALPPERRGFSMVFQNYALFPNLTVAENIAYGLGRLSPADRHKRVTEMLALIKMEGRGQSYPGQLSGGQRQRVALGRALATCPRLLLLDEPLSALDAQVRADLAHELRAIQQLTGVTAIMVTHDQVEAMSLADRIVLMRQGQVEQSGAPSDLYHSPASLFAAEFLGHTNILSMAGVEGGRTFGIRYEDVRVLEPLERVIATSDTLVGRLERSVLMGSFSRLEVLLNDFKTKLYADVPSNGPAAAFAPGAIVAVRLPAESRLCW